MTRRPRLLDLFCGAGGAAAGYHDAGFDVVGWDLLPQPHFPFFDLGQGDALAVLDDVAYVREFDAVHTSPPCQRYTALHTRAATQATTPHHHPNGAPPVIITCGTCGAQLSNPAAHERWHDGYDELVERVVNELDGPASEPPVLPRDPEDTCGHELDLFLGPRVVGFWTCDLPLGHQRTERLHAATAVEKHTDPDERGFSVEGVRLRWPSA